VNNDAITFVFAREIDEIVGTSERVWMLSAFMIGVLRHHLAAVLFHNYKFNFTRVREYRASGLTPSSPAAHSARVLPLPQK
jgi:hypothetical protein